MAEYIERGKAIQICQSYYEHCLEMHDFCGDSVAYDIRENIQGLPTADVVEVKHGEWIADRNPVEVAFICSECKYRYFFADPEEECEYNFCPHCGAKMDLKEGAEK